MLVFRCFLLAVVVVAPFHLQPSSVLISVQLYSRVHKDVHHVDKHPSAMGMLSSTVHGDQRFCILHVGWAVNRGRNSTPCLTGREGSLSFSHGAHYPQLSISKLPLAVSIVHPHNR